MYGQLATSGSCAHHLAGRVDNGTPFSPQLRRVIISVMGWRPGVVGSELETARLLNRLDVDMDDVGDRDKWQRLLVDVVRSPTGREALSSHN